MNSSDYYDRYDDMLERYNDMKKDAELLKIEIDDEFKKLYQLDNYSLDDFILYMKYYEKNYF